MKKIGLILLFISSVVAVKAQEFTAKKPGDSAPVPKFEWKAETHDFGRIEKDKPVTHEFRFQNIGSAPLIITKVKGSCGCTVAEYSKEPITPGEWGSVKATFNAAATGHFTKTVTVTANTEGGPVVLRLKGEVVKKQDL